MLPKPFFTQPEQDAREVTRASEKLAANKRVKKVTIRDEEFPKITRRKIKRFEVDLLMMDRQQVT